MNASRNPVLWLWLRTPARTAAAVALGMMLVAGAQVMTGCVTKPTPQAVAYLTLADTQKVVDKAMKFYGAQCAAGNISVENQARIDAAHDRYRTAFRGAVLLARTDYKQLTPDNVLFITNELLALIQKL